MSELETPREKLDLTLSSVELEKREKAAVIDELNATYNRLSRNDYFKFRVDGDFQFIEISGYVGVLKTISIWGDSPAAIILDIAKAMLEYM